jgi:hypothetical protein
MSVNTLESILNENLVVPVKNKSSFKKIKKESDEWNLIKNLCDELIKSEKAEHVKIVFRGENKDSLKNKLSSDEDGQFFNKLFLFGDKAKYFFSPECFEKYRSSDRQKNQLFEQSSRDYLLNINDSSDKTFQFIFNQLKKIFTTSYHSGGDNHKVISKFSNQNPEFCEFFRCQENPNNFLEKINSFDAEAKIEFRDYYLYLLHTFGEHQYQPISFFVSTSANKDTTAEYFARGEKTSKPIIIVYFVPEPFYPYGMSLSLALKFNEKYKDVEIPFYKSDFYPESSEISIKGALFPHYILGIYDLDQKTFIVNPHIFSNKSNKPIKKIIQEGFDIEQNDFKTMVAEKTKYAGFVLMQEIYSE